MTKNNLILRLSNGIGNQMFMFSAGYSFSKKLRRNFLIDDESAFKIKKNISFYCLNEFNLNCKIADKKKKFLGFNGYLKRKFSKIFDKFRTKKKFLVEYKNLNKISQYDKNLLSRKFNKDLFLEGHFETEKYFQSYRKQIINQFRFKYSKFYKNNKYYKLIKNSNSVSICIRQNRFSEKLTNNFYNDDDKSYKYSLEQIIYVKKAIKYFNKKIDNPKYFLWSNDYTNLENFFNPKYFVYIKNPSKQKIGSRQMLDLFLMTNAKHFVVIPSTFNWWGAYLSEYKNKIVVRPDKNKFSDFKISNNDFWPKNWKCL